MPLRFIAAPTKGLHARHARTAFLLCLCVLLGLWGIKERTRAQRLEATLARAPIGKEAGFEQIAQEDSAALRAQPAALQAADAASSAASIVADESEAGEENIRQNEEGDAESENPDERDEEADEEGDPRPENPLAAALEAAAAAASFAVAAARRHNSKAAAAVAAAAEATHRAASKAASTATDDPDEALSEALAAAAAEAAAAAVAVEGHPGRVHAAAAAAAVSTAATEGAAGHLEAAAFAGVRAATAANAAALVRSSGTAKGRRCPASEPLVPGSRLCKHSSDVVYVTFTTVERHRLVVASRAWRKPLGIRAVVLTNVNTTEFNTAELEEHGETWAYYPDLAPGWEDRAFYKGDKRAAMAPLIAHRLLKGEYLWLIYGDDDGIFFPEGFVRAIDALDPALPYFVSDSQGGFGVDDDTNPAEWNPRCVPCTWDSQGQDESAVPVPPLRGCPCNTTTICHHWRKHVPEVFETCDPEALLRPSPEWLSIHGDAGALLSVGLLRELDYGAFETCIDNEGFGGGDGKLSRCIWRAGFGLTDPGFSYLSNDILNHYTFDRWSLRRLSDPPGLVEALQRKIVRWRNSGFCSVADSTTLSNCLVPDDDDELFVMMASTHASAREFETIEQAASAIELLSEVYRYYVRCLYETYSEVLTLRVEPGAGS